MKLAILAPTLWGASLLLFSLSTKAASYEYRADQFSVGNFVEDFSSPNNSFRPWLGGTVTYQDGHAIFTDPGIVISPCGENCSSEYSAIAYNTSESGANNFETQSIWSSQYLSALPGGTFGQYFFQGEVVVMGITNFSVETANRTGTSAGLTATFSRLDGGGAVLEYQSVAISQEDILGDIVFRLAFDSGLQQITAEYSLNGGSSFNSPFDGYDSSGYGTHVLYGSSVLPSAIPIPAAAWLFSSAMIGLVTFRKTQR